jgi:hypothetical protein
MSMAKKKVENLRARAPNRPGFPFPEFFAILESSGEDSRFHRDYWKTLQLLLIISSVFGVRIKLQKFFVISSCFSKTGIAVEHAISFQIALLICRHLDAARRAMKASARCKYIMGAFASMLIAIPSQKIEFLCCLRLLDVPGSTRFLANTPSGNIVG